MPTSRYTLAVTRGNVLPRFTGGQVVCRQHHLAKNVLGLARQTIAQRHRDLDLAVKECLGDATNASNEREGEPIMTTTHDDTATSWRDLADQLTPKQTKSLDKI